MFNQRGFVNFKSKEHQNPQKTELENAKSFLNKMNLALVDMESQMDTFQRPISSSGSTRNVIPKISEVTNASTLLEIQDILALLN